MPLNNEQRKRSAEELHANPLLTEVLESMSKDIVDRWMSATSRKKRESAWRDFQAVEAFKISMYAVVTSFIGEDNESSRNG